METFGNSTVSSCFNIGEVNGQGNIGGIVGIQGTNSTTLIENCYNTGEITSIMGNIGGISYVNGNTTGSEIKNSYNVGEVTVSEKTNSNIRRNCRNNK